jgi:hypothetical protein
MTDTAVAIVRGHNGHQLDTTLVAVATGTVGAYSDAQRLTDAGMSQIAWWLEDVPAEDFPAVGSDLRSVFGGTATVTVLNVAAATPASVPPPPAT